MKNVFLFTSLLVLVFAVACKGTEDTAEAGLVDAGAEAALTDGGTETATDSGTTVVDSGTSVDAGAVDAAKE